MIRALMASFILAVSCLGCIDTGIGGGTDTGSEIEPNVPPGDPNQEDSILLFEKQSSGLKDPNWLDTDQNYSLNFGDFTSYTETDEGILFSTNHLSQSDVEFKDVHSHYYTQESVEWSNYSFRGSFLIDNSEGALGITFYSQFPHSTSYYSIRRLNQPNNQRHYPEFHFYASNGEKVKDGCESSPGSVGKWRSSVIPTPDVWYQTEILVETHLDYTEIKAKIWPEQLPPPTEFQIVCRDYRSNRLNKGTVGIWTGKLEENRRYIDFGKKYFDDFIVTPLDLF